MRRPVSPIVGGVVLVLALLGCGVSYAPLDGQPATADGPLPRDAAPATAASDAVSNLVVATTSDGLSRKIIYTANVDLRVENFSEVPTRIVELVKRHEAFVANSELTGITGTSRRGSWTIRVPVAQFEAFLDAAKGLGELVSAGVQSQDVSEEYVDVEARIRNKTKEEERLIKLLEERPGELKDVLAIERELSRVREETERMQGRMRVLTDQTTLTTVQLVVQEFRKYTPREAPAFGQRVKRSFRESVRDVRRTGETAAVGLAGLAPWLPFWMLGLGALYWGGRRLTRKLWPAPVEASLAPGAAPVPPATGLH